MQGIDGTSKNMWKKILTYLFPLQAYLRKKRRVKQLKEASVSGEDWCEVQKKRIGKDGI